MSKIKNLFIIFAAVLLISCSDEIQDGKKTADISLEDKAKPSDEPEEQIVYIKINKFSFEPDAVNITAGTTVIWENADTNPHFIMTPQSGFQSQVLKPGEQFKLNFYSPRVHKYVEPNFGIIGYINVK